MKILQIIYSLSSGGAERFVVDLSNELASQGHEVYLCTLLDDSVKNQDFYKSEISNQINYINLKQSSGLNLLNISAISKTIHNIKPAIVHCHLNLVNYVFPLSIWYKKIRFFYTIHNDAQKEVSSKFEYWIRRFFFSTQKFHAITISNETSISFGEFYKTRNFTEIYNGIRKPMPSIEYSIVSSFINNLKTNNQVVFLHIGRCSPQKNQKMLIEVFNKLQKEHKKVILLIIGDGFDSVLGNELKSIASDKIIFLGIKRGIADYLLNVDAFCLSSLHEGMPITLIEALACGCIPICTAVGGISDTIINYKTGFLSESISEHDYYQAIMAFLEDKGKIIKNNLIKQYYERFSIKECATKHCNLYKYYLFNDVVCKK